MWIFGYGSLMFDDWEKSYGCQRREKASLLGYERSFTKGSTVNWGSRTHPAPTLRLVAREGAVCHGVAFAFGSDKIAPVLDYLQEREGKSFQRRPVTLKLETGEKVDGTCFFYEGRNVIANENPEDLAAMALSAAGRDGTGLDYIRKTKSELDAAGIRDERVDELFAVITRLTA